MLIATVGFLTMALLSACDPAHGFNFSNETAETLVITYKIYEVDRSDGPLSENSYLVASADSVDTQDDESLGGDQGGEIFNSSHELLVCAFSQERLRHRRLYTFD